MHRRDFGQWGVELQDDDFARALAALGVLLARDPRLDVAPASIISRLTDLAAATAWPVPWSLTEDPARLESEGLPGRLAQVLAAAWQGSGLPGRVRIEIDRFSPLRAGFDPVSALPWVVHELSRPAVGALSVFISVDDQGAEVAWLWPLRLGFLNDRASRALVDDCRTMMQSRDWISRLIVPVDMQDPAAACDLLLLPMDLRAALSSVAALRTAPHADCIAVLGREQGGTDQWFRQLVGLRGAAHTSGVLVARVPARDAVDWVANVVRELSHNHPFDVAAFNASREIHARPPSISASRQFIELSQLSRRMRRMADQFRTPAFENLAIEIPPDSRAAGMFGSSGLYSLREVASQLQSISEAADVTLSPEAFMHETGAATLTAEVAAAAATARESVLESRAVGKSQPRFIQAKVYETGVPASLVLRRQSLRAGQPHEVRVRIGIPEADWVSAPPTMPFPDEALPPGDSHELTVVLAEPNLLGEPQIGHVTLPRAGNSSECAFWIFARPGVARLNARIIVAHRNRVLQTALLRCPITAGDEDQGEGAIAVEPEVLLREALDDLADRRMFDAALVLNHDEAGTPGITAISQGAVGRLNVSDAMRGLLDQLDRMLTQIVYDPKAFMGDLVSDANTDLLRQFAQLGNVLYDHIVRDEGLAYAGLAGDGPIQVVSAVADARLPVEFIYTREAPAKGARMCPNARRALEVGECDPQSCSKGRDAICPLGFWGARRVIERHAHDPKFKALLAGDAFAIKSEPAANRRTLDVLRAGLVAASQRVEKTIPGGADQVCRAIAAASSSSKTVTTWDAWEQRIDAETPSLLVLIVHTEASPENAAIQQMEIGVDSWLTVAELDLRHVRRADAPPPLVLLLGCETGVPEKQFANFINRLRNRGAAIVVATGAKIHSLHAVPVANAFVEALAHAVKRDGATFGEVMRQVRRSMLARGLPMVLTLNAFGDADWRLVHQA